jgi:hypothetical protein
MPFSRMTLKNGVEDAMKKSDSGSEIGGSD